MDLQRPIRSSGLKETERFSSCNYVHRFGLMISKKKDRRDNEKIVGQNDKKKDEIKG
jgi:hypothetical protein